MKHRIVWISGAPGSGKSTALNHIISGAKAEGRKTTFASGEATTAGVAKCIKEWGSETVCIEAEGGRHFTKESIEQLATQFPEVFFYVVI